MKKTNNFVLKKKKNCKISLLSKNVYTNIVNIILKMYAPRKFKAETLNANLISLYPMTIVNRNNYGQRWKNNVVQ